MGNTLYRTPEDMARDDATEQAETVICFARLEHNSPTERSTETTRVLITTYESVSRRSKKWSAGDNQMIKNTWMSHNHVYILSVER